MKTGYRLPKWNVYEVWKEVSGPNGLDDDW
jgi:hypothetical protein